MRVDEWGRRFVLGVLALVVVATVTAPLILTHQVNARVTAVRYRAAQSKLVYSLKRTFARPPWLRARHATLDSSYEQG